MIDKQEMREKKRILKAEEKPKSQGSEETKCKETGKQRYKRLLKESCLKYGIEPAPDPLESSIKEYSDNKD